MASKRYKVVLLGDGRVGKTSLVQRFVRGLYDEGQKSSVQASYLDKTVAVGAQSVKLSIWDTAGQERFHALGPLYYREADAALLVYDITDEQSFIRVKDWVKELHAIVGTGIILVIAGNKADLERSRVVRPEAAEAYAKSVGAAHFLTSAKANKGVDSVFTDIATKILARHPATPMARPLSGQYPGPAGAGGPEYSGAASVPAKKRGLVIEEDLPPPKSSGGCCS